jgi:carbamoyl-phosphate synthase small subunit
MVGYPEALTDPSYRGQILCLTYPLIGNYGVPSYELDHDIPTYFESDRIEVRALIVHELCSEPYHWASTRSLDKWLSNGVMLGIIKMYDDEEEPNTDAILDEAKRIQDPNSTDLVKEVTVKEPIHYRAKGAKTVVLIDCGVKFGIMRNLLKHGINVVKVPSDFSEREIMEYKPDGVFLSNGPGDPRKCGKTIETVQKIVERVPLMGICLGAQVLTLALNGDTYKLKFGHRSQNQPALDLKTNRCYITTQNHGYAIETQCFHKTPLEPWFVNANDKTIEGVKHRSRPAFAVQWHPEASPGPYDTDFLFGELARMMETA